MNSFEIIEQETDGGEYLKFDMVENKASSRPDLSAFILLDKLFPGKTDNLISACTHDVFYLDISEDEVKSINKADALTLIRCGVRYGEDGLRMFA